MEEKELPPPLTISEAFGKMGEALQDDPPSLREILDEMSGGKKTVLGVPTTQQREWDERIKVGDVVYIAYTPIQCGVVTKVEKLPDSFFTLVTFVGLKKTWTEWSSALNDYTKLVADHKRKYDRHKKTLKALEELGSNPR